MVFEMAFRARKLSGTFEKRAPESVIGTETRDDELSQLFRFQTIVLARHQTFDSKGVTTTLGRRLVVVRADFVASFNCTNSIACALSPRVTNAGCRLSSRP